MKILVTGCLGFIGSHFIKYTIRHKRDVEIVGFSRNTDQRNLKRLAGAESYSAFRLIYGDLSENISGLLEGVDIVIHFAAKTFVDHSIKDPAPFIHSNILGTYNLLEEARKYKPQLFVNTSTDEVYGSIPEGAYKEDAQLNPSNPYSSTKAAADMLVISYGNTYGLPYIITRTENNYGSYQHPQKVFPAFVKKALNDEDLPIYGDGLHKRMWLRVEDYCSAIWHLIDREKRGIYHVAGEQELENIELAQKILTILGKPKYQITYVDDTTIRPGHDRRYALNCEKIKKTGWAPKYTLEEGIKEVAEWYKQNPWWLQ